MNKRKEIKRTIEQTIQDINYCIENAEPEDILATTRTDIETYKKSLETELWHMQIPNPDSPIEKLRDSAETLRDYALVIGKAVGFVYLMPVFMAAAVVAGLGHGAYKGGKVVYNKVKKHYESKHQTNDLEDRL